MQLLKKFLVNMCVVLGIVLCLLGFFAWLFAMPELVERLPLPWGPVCAVALFVTPIAFIAAIFQVCNSDDQHKISAD